jgi:hypothetical protein
MAAGLGGLDVLVRILGDSSQLTREVSKVSGSMDKLKGYAKGAALSLGAVFGVKVVGDWVDRAEAAASTAAKLQQVFSNAGDTTGEWAKHAEDLSTALSEKTGIDKLQIQAGQVLLATSKGISATMKAQPAIFDKATKAALDLSKSGFGDVTTASKVLTKALEDPKAGLTALHRIGVSFNTDEKAKIDWMLASGNSAEAYSIILDKIEGKVGGVAEKSATATDKLHVAWQNVQQQLGQALLPVLDAVVPLIGVLATFVEKNATWLVPMAVGIAAVVVAVKLWIGVQTLLNALLATFGAEEAVVTGPLALIALAIIAVYAAVAVLYAKWDAVWSFIAGLPWYLKVAAAIIALTNPVLTLILVASTLAVYWTDIWHIVVAVVEWAVDRIKSLLSGVVDSIGQVATGLAGLKNAATGGGFSGLGSNLLGIPGLKAFHIPGFASGGIVTRPTLAMIGEAGPEAVVPLDKTGGFGGSITVNVYSTGLGPDSPRIQSDIARALDNWKARNGS